MSPTLVAAARPFGAKSLTAGSGDECGGHVGKPPVGIIEATRLKGS